MPAAAYPNRRDYFVYSMTAQGQSFYVGVGRSARASDRVRYVRYLVKRQIDGRPVKWVLSNEVIAALIGRGVNVASKQLRTGLTRAEALGEERRIIEWFRRRGVLLANRQLNGGFQLTAQVVLRDIRRRCRAKNAHTV
jgi:hypothetical protein